MTEKVWAYHPEKGSELFDSIDDVPPGWADSPDFDNDNTMFVPENEPEPENTKRGPGRPRKNK